MARFGKEDWLKLGANALKSDGPTAMTIERLTQAAQKTRGSFYHHFDSRDAFLEALIGWWQAESTLALATRLQAAATPQDKRAIMHDVSTSWDGAFEVALRQLAAMEPMVAAQLAQVDELRIQGLASMITLLHPDIEDAYSYAFVQYASVVGGQWLLPTRDDPRIPAIKTAGNRIFKLL